MLGHPPQSMGPRAAAPLPLSPQRLGVCDLPPSPNMAPKHRSEVARPSHAVLRCCWQASASRPAASSRPARAQQSRREGAALAPPELLCGSAPSAHSPQLFRFPSGNRDMAWLVLQSLVVKVTRPGRECDRAPPAGTSSPAPAVPAPFPLCSPCLLGLVCIASGNPQLLGAPPAPRRRRDRPLRPSPGG